MLSAELSTGHFFGPGETLTRPDPLSHEFYIHKFIIQGSNREHYMKNCRMISEEKKDKYFSSGLVMFPAWGWKNDLECFFTTAVSKSRQQKDCKRQMLVKCIRGLIWAGLNSEVWIDFIL